MKYATQSQVVAQIRKEYTVKAVSRPQECRDSRVHATAWDYFLWGLREVGTLLRSTVWMVLFSAAD